jgi:polyhydroxyalkanoate synthesis regulator phasin
VPTDDLFKRYVELGASMLGMSRERAESIVRDLVASGEVARKEAAKAADWLVERGRTGSEEFNEQVRRQIREQVAALGLATKDDIARLQAEIDDLKAPPVPKKAAPAAKKAPVKKVPAKKSAAQKSATKEPAAEDAAAKKAGGAAKPAGISRAASAGRGLSGSPPAAGDAVPPKG